MDIILKLNQADIKTKPSGKHFMVRTPLADIVFSIEAMEAVLKGYEEFKALPKDDEGFPL